MPRQVDVASGGLCERKEFSRRILPLRSAKRLLEKAPSIYYRLAKRFFSGLSIECYLGAQRLRRLIRPSPFSIPQIAGHEAGCAAAPCPNTDFLGALLVHCPPLGRNPIDCRGQTSQKKTSGPGQSQFSAPSRGRGMSTQKLVPT